MTMAMAAAMLAAGAMLSAAPTAASPVPQAQSGTPAARRNVEVAGDVVVLADAVPAQNATELRSRLRVEATVEPSASVRMRFEGSAEALAADRSGRATAATGRVRDAWIEVAGRRGDVRAGVGRVIWGRLDEIQPSDVINPLDTARFLLDGRAEARRAVAFVRARLFATDALSVEAVVVPVFRRATFDELDEDSSPFTLTRDAVLPAVSGAPRVRHQSPEAAWRNVSGGGRMSATVGRVDVAVGVFRGFDGFGTLTFEPAVGAAPAVVGALVERYPRFTMVSADFETVRGDWAIRGEVAAFPERTLAGTNGFGGVEGRAVDAGVGVDRAVGETRVFGSVLWQRQWSALDPSVRRANASLVGSIERPFARERYRARVFAVVNPADRTAFLRGLFTWSAADNVAIEASAGTFLGEGDDTLSRFVDRDFAFGRLRLSF